LQEIGKNPAAVDERTAATTLINAIQKNGLGIETPAADSAPKVSLDASLHLAN